MKRRMRGVFAPKVLIPLLAVGAVGFGAVGVMSLLQRRGEAAIALIPADAMMAVSFDNTPAASQVLLFNEIAAAMEDSGVNRFVDEMLESSGAPPEVKSIKENLKGSFALGVWGDVASGKPDTLLAAALKDPASAEGAISKHAEKVKNASMSVYSFEEDVFIAFHDDYVLVANSLKTLERSIDAADDEIESLDQVGAFKKARAALPGEASLMVFVNGEAIARADEDTKKMYKAFGIEKAGWAAMSATVLAEGIQLDVFQDMEGSATIANAYESLSDLTYDSAAELPSGAIGVAGLSGAGTMLKTLFESLQNSELSKDFQKGLADMEKETGLSFEEEIVPALAGETYFALYPPKQSKDDPSFVITFDETNQADPESAARKIIASVDDFKMSKVGAAEVYIDGTSASDEPVIAIFPDRVMVTNDRTLITDDPEKSLTSVGGLANFDDGDPAKFKMQIDMRTLFGMIRKFSGEDMPNLEQALSQDTLDIRWTVQDGTATGRVLIPFKLPELIRIAGKEAQKHKPVQGADESIPPMAMPEASAPKDLEQIKSNGQQVAKALLMYAGDNGDQMPTFEQFGKGAIDPYLGDPKIREDFMYMPPFEDSDPKKTEVGFFMAPSGRVVVMLNGEVKYEAYTDAPTR